MARLKGIDGLVQNQSTLSNGTNAYIRTIAIGKNDIGTFLRITASTSAPRIYFFVNATLAFTQTNGASDFNSAIWKKYGTMYNAQYGYTEMYNWGTGTGNNTGFGVSGSNPSMDFYVWSTTAGSWPGKFSITMEIYCSRWDWVTLTTLA